MTPARSLWHHPDFLKLWVGQTISEVGSRVTRDGLPLVAVMLLGATPGQMGVLSALGGFAVLLISLPAGAWADRVRRRPVLVTMDVARAVVLGAVPLAWLAGVLTFPLLCVIAALAGALTVCFDVAYQAYLPVLVERGRLLEGNSKLALSAATAEVVGPALAGTLVQALTAPIAITVDALSFLASAVAVMLIRHPEPQPVPAARPDLRGEIVDGLRTVRRSRVLSALALRAAMAYFFFGMVATLYTLYAVRELGLTPVLLGLVITTGGVSNLLGALFAERIATRLGARRALLLSSVTLGLATMFLPLAGGSVARGAAFLIAQQVLGDWAGVVYAVQDVSLRQQVTPPELLGRVNSVMQVMTRGVLPLGSLAGGLIAESFGMRATLWVAATGVLLSSAFVLLIPSHTRTTQSV